MDKFSICQICEHEEEKKYCKKCRNCNENVCLNCIGLTKSSKSSTCVCSECFDYRCMRCKITDLSTEYIYLSYESPYPLCQGCNITCNICDICNEKADDKMNVCKVCKIIRVCSRCFQYNDKFNEYNGYICSNCSKCYDSCERCEQIILEYSLYVCEKCNKHVCLDCSGLSGCQTEWCICYQCFDYKCTQCHIEDLDHDLVYLMDAKPIPVCDKCTLCSKCNIVRSSLLEICSGCMMMVCSKCTLSDRDDILCSDCAIFDICQICKEKKEFGCYTCEKCDRMVCLNCIGLTACQTDWCICNECFDYKCTECHIEDLSGDTYLEDGDLYLLPICDGCKMKLKLI